MSTAVAPAQGRRPSHLRFSKSLAALSDGVGSQGSLSELDDAYASVVKPPPPWLPQRRCSTCGECCGGGGSGSGYCTARNTPAASDATEFNFDHVDSGADISGGGDAHPSGSGGGGSTGAEPAPPPPAAARPPAGTGRRKLTLTITADMSTMAIGDITHSGGGDGGGGAVTEEDNEFGWFVGGADEDEGGGAHGGHDGHGHGHNPHSHEGHHGHSPAQHAHANHHAASAPHHRRASHRRNSSADGGAGAHWYAQQYRRTSRDGDEGAGGGGGHCHGCANGCAGGCSTRSLSPAFQLVQMWQQTGGTPRGSGNAGSSGRASIASAPTSLGGGSDVSTVLASVGSAFSMRSDTSPGGSGEHGGTAAAAAAAEAVQPHPPPHVTSVPYHLSTKCFQMTAADGSSRATQFTIGISAVRVVCRRHAEYQVVVSSDDGIWMAWRRYTQFKTLVTAAARALGSKGQLVDAVWAKLQKDMKLGRCLNTDYLCKKKRYLEWYLSELLFALPTPALLLDFVADEHY